VTIDWQKLAEERAKSGHALLGPSTLPGLMRCAGMLLASTMLNAQNLDTEFSAEGTNAHFFAETVLVAQRTNTEARAADYADAVLGDEIGTMFVPDEEMIQAVQEYVDWCNELPGTHFTETRVDLNGRMPLKNQFGTSDHGAVYHRTLVVTDFKYGKGVKVYAEENEQAMGYAIGMYDELSWGYEIDKVIIRICQPRFGHFDVWETTVERLMEFAKEMHAQCTVALAPNPPTRAGEKQCFFCAVAGRCGTQLKASIAALNSDFDAMDAPGTVEILTPEQVAKALESVELVKLWARRTRTAAMRLLVQDPVAVPGWKIVESQSRRAWLDQQRAEVWLQKQGLRESQVVKRTLISPAQAEKMLTRGQKSAFKKVNESAKLKLVYKPTGHPSLAPVTDKRPIFANVRLAEFDEFEGQDEFSEFENESDELTEL